MSASIHHKSEEGMYLFSALPLTEHFYKHLSQNWKTDFQEYPGPVEIEEYFTILTWKANQEIHNQTIFIPLT